MRAEAPIQEPGAAVQRIGYGRQSIDETDVEAVLSVLRGDWLTQGPAVDAFEAALMLVTGARHAVAVNSGTAALHLALASLGIGEGCRVLTTPNTFLASANAALYCGAEVEFVDVEPDSWLLDLDLLEQRLESGPAIDAVVAVDFAGAPCDRERLARLRERFGFRLVLDACHGLGGRADEGPVGGESSADAVCFSFHPVKHITTGEGGALLTADPEVAERARLLRSHGIERGTSLLPFTDHEGAPPAWFGPMQALGFNYRLSDLGAALGTSQLARLDEFVERRRCLASRYDEGLAGIEGLSTPRPVAGHAYHLYVIHVPAERRDELMARLSERGIGTQLHYYPVCKQPYYEQRYGPIAVPEAERHARTAISLPLYPELSDGDQDRVIIALRELMGEAT